MTGEPLTLRHFWLQQVRAWGALLLFVALPLDLLFRLDSFTAVLGAGDIIASTAGFVLLLALAAVTIASILALLILPLRRIFGSGILAPLYSVTCLLIFYLACRLFAQSVRVWLKLVQLPSIGSSYFITLLLIILAVAVWRRTMPQRIAGLLRVSQGWQLAAVGLSLLVVVVRLLTASHDSPAAPVAASPAGAPRPNIIMVTFDALSAGDMSLYGYHLPTTPAIEDFARMCTTYDNAYSTSNATIFAIPSLLTGLYPAENGIYRFSPYARIPREIAGSSLPALLRQGGYRTYAAVALTDFAHPSTLGLSRHFDRAPLGYVDWPATPLYHWPGRFHLALRHFGGLQLAERYGIYSLVWLAEYLLENKKLFRILPDGSGSTPPFPPDRATDGALSLLREHRQTRGGQPFFLWLHYFQPHSPYLPTPGQRGRFLPDQQLFGDLKSQFPFEEGTYDPAQQRAIDNLRLRYDESIASVDESFGRLVRELKQEGALDDALMIVAADHGESFGQGYLGHCGPYFYQSLVRVPLLVKRPGSSTGSRTDRLASLVDVPVTILDAAQLPVPGTMRGMSLLDASRQREQAICQVPDGVRGRQMRLRSAALIRPPYKLVHDASSGQNTLFDQHDRVIGPGQAGPGDTIVSELHQRLNDVMLLGGRAP